MNQNDQMREAFREALEMLQHFRRHVDIDETTYSELVATCDKLEQALAAEPAPLVRLTDEDLLNILHKTKDNLLPFEHGALLFGRAIMDAMERVNGGANE